MKKIISTIINFFKLLFQTLISPFLKDKKEDKKEQNNSNIIRSEKLEQLKKQQIDLTGATTGTRPDDNPLLSNPHDTKTEDGETESTRIYTFPKQFEKVLNPNEKYSYLAFSDEEIDAYIDDELEDVYKEKGFKVYKANNVIKKRIEKLKKQIVPIIKDKIYYNNITDEKLLKREIKEIVAEHLQLTPIFEEELITIKKEEKKEEPKVDPYFIAKPQKKELELPELAVKVDKNDVIVNVEDKKAIEEKLEMPSLRMVQNVDKIPEPSVVSELPKLAVAGALAATKGIIETFTTNSDLPKLKEEKELEKNSEEEVVLPKEIDTPTEELPQEIIEEEKKEEIEVELPTLEDAPAIEELELEEAVEIATEVESITTETEEVIEEIEEIDKTVEEVIENQEKLEQEVEKEAEKEEKEQEIIEEQLKKDIDLDIKIDSLDNKTFDAIDSAKKEAHKSDFFDKDYDSEEEKINKLLDRIENTRIKYGDKLTPEQKERLKTQEEKLRSTKNKLKTAREKDIAFEKKELEDGIKEVEINGLQKEIAKMNLEYKAEANEELLKKIDKLEGMTEEQVANIDKKILMSRFNKASFLLEMASLLAFPFVRNKYFRLFTIGLVVDNHLGFAHAFLNRKRNRYQPVDLEGIRKGSDALDSAIDLAYKDLVQLDYIEEQALSKHPELADDPAFQASITRVRNNLTNQFNKLQKKQQTMEKYMEKGFKQRKTLKKIEAAA